MRSSYLLAAGLCLAAMTIQPAIGAPQPGEGDLDGVYEFVRLDAPDGPNTSQKGMMIVKGDYLCHIRVRKEREKRAQGDSQEERARKSAAALRGANASCGHFTADGSQVNARWKVAIDPNIEENTPQYTFVLEGDTLRVSPATAPEFKFVYKKIQ
ncbi:MAG: hypothetical protein ACE5JX_07570 [Acidobacteriota bacterium]